MIGSPARPLAASVLIIAVTARKGRSTWPVAGAVLVAAAIAGLFAGQMRLETIDGRAMELPAASGAGMAPAAGGLTLTGFVEAEPARSRGEIRFRFASGRGRVMVEAADPGPGRLPGAGDGLRLSGTAGPAPDWYRPVLERHGLKVLFRAERIEPTGERRGGVGGIIDRMRERAERALGEGMPVRESALARGFVLGQDAGIDGRTTADFRASGLSHLLAVSGQNVVLLGLLAWPVLALAGTGIQARRLLTVLLILIYIPLAGGGASIQRAGVMGIAGLAVAGAGRAGSRLWALTLAAAVTLGLDPRATLDPGWQLSFAAVAGIALLSAPLRRRLGGTADRAGWRGVLAEGAAITVAATAATAPLIAFHFGRLPVGTVAANLAVLPAVAPAMWLGMIAAAAGQIRPELALPFNLLDSVVLAMIARIAHWFGGPHWAEVKVELGPAGLAAAVLALAAGFMVLFRFWRPGSRGSAGGGSGGHRVRVLAVVVVVAAGAAGLGGIFGSGRRDLADPPPGGARIELLDIGQGDAILIRPAGSLPLLIDGGPPGGDLNGALASAGVDHLAAVLLTHPHLDHYGGLYDLFPGVTVDRLLYRDAPGKLRAAARSAGAGLVGVAAGRRLTLGAGVRLELLWPPPERPPPGPGEDANAVSVGALLTWHDFRMYLPGDGETEAVPVDPGPIDVLKVAHHGSADAGLAGLLSRDRPEVAMIEVGAGNRFGHPTAETLAALASAGVRIFRTDRDGTISIVLDQAGYRIETGR